MLDFLAHRMPNVTRDAWCQRMLAGYVVDERGQPVAPERRFEGGLRLYYYRSLSAEPVLPFSETVLFQVSFDVGFIAIVVGGAMLAALAEAFRRGIRLEADAEGLV